MASGRKNRLELRALLDAIVLQALATKGPRLRRFLLRLLNAGALRVVVVNQAFVRRHLGNRNPLGMQLSIGNGPPDWPIVGVVADVVYETTREGPRPTVYAPYLQRGAGAATFELQVASSPAQVAVAVRRVVQSRIPGIPVTVRTAARNSNGA